MRPALAGSAAFLCLGVVFTLLTPASDFVCALFLVVGAGGLVLCGIAAAIRHPHRPPARACRCSGASRASEPTSRR